MRQMVDFVDGHVPHGQDSGKRRKELVRGKEQENV
jgi:hypothetical protein